MTETATLAPPDVAAPGAAGAAVTRKPLTPWDLFWREMKRSPLSLLCGWILIFMYLCTLLAEPLAPYSYDTQDEEHPFHPPTALHVRTPEGRFTWPPYVNGTEIADLSSSQFTYRTHPEQRYPLRFLVQGDPYKFLGLVPSTLHFFGVQEPGHVFLLGSDQFGRDILSRLLYGSRVSLTIGLVGVFLTFLLGMLIGGLAGYLGGWVDTATMRLTEVLMSIPGLYLILALRAMFPVDMPSAQLYLLIVVILSFVGWASLARVVRGMVLSLRSREYVTAVQALGAGSAQIVFRHILPNTLSFVIVAATVSIPSYILGEVTLSYLGVGIQDPYASWGNMLSQAQNVDFLKSYPWIMIPGVAIFVAVMAFNFLGDGLRDALDPRRASGGKV